MVPWGVEGPSRRAERKEDDCHLTFGVREMRNCLFTLLFVACCAVYGCAIWQASEGTEGEAEAPGAPVAGTSEGESQEATSSTGADAAEEPVATAVPAVEKAPGTEAAASQTPQDPTAEGGTAGTPPEISEAQPVTAAATSETTATTALTPSAALLDPGLTSEKAPDVFKVKFSTTRGDFIVEVVRSWAPIGADRLFNLVKIGFFTDVAFFRVMKNFVVQFGIHGDPEVTAAWREATIPDDDVIESNQRGMVSFANRRAPNTRTTQMFISLAGMNNYLDAEGYAPIGKVIEGMEVVDSLHNAYGDGPPRGSGPKQAMIQSQGNSYLQSDFPDLDYVKTAVIME